MIDKKFEEAFEEAKEFSEYIMECADKYFNKKKEKRTDHIISMMTLLSISIIIKNQSIILEHIGGRVLADKYLRGCLENIENNNLVTATGVKGH